MQVVKCDSLQSFGMTELSPVDTIISADDHRRGFVDKPVPKGTMGEIIVPGDLR